MIINNNVLEKIFEGMTLTVDVIKKTLGPNSKNVVLTNNNKTIISSDGLTIASNLEFSELKKVGNDLLVNASSITKNMIGDGTTSTMVISYEFIKNSKTSKIYNVSNYLDEILLIIFDELDKISFPITTIEQLYNVSYTSCNDEGISKIISEIIYTLGKYSFINLKPTYKNQISFSYEDGYSYDKGYISPYLTKDEKIILKNCVVIIVNDEITKIVELEELIGEVKNEFKDLLLIAINYSKEVIDYIIYLKKSYNFNICATLAPSYGKDSLLFLDDLSVYLDAYVVTTKNLYSKIEYKSIVDTVIVSKNNTIIKKSNLNMPRIKERINYLKKELENKVEDVTQIRLAKIENKIATIYVPSLKDYNYEILKEKINNSINSTYNAYQDKAVYGAGYGIYQVYENLKNKYKDETIRSLVFNEIINSLPCIKDLINKEFNNLIIDPLKNIKVILENSIYVLKLFNSIDSVVIKKDLDKNELDIF